MVLGYSTSTNLPWVDGLSMGPSGSGRHIGVSSFIGGSPTLEMDKGERPPSPIKGGLSPLVYGRKGILWAFPTKEWEAQSDH